ncbi:hypothetical protein MTO96_003505 [Rhipicephalus appendiculatus]
MTTLGSSVPDMTSPNPTQASRNSGAVKVPARRVVGFAFGPLRPVIRRATPPTLSAPSCILCAAVAGTARLPDDDDRDERPAPMTLSR